MLIQEAETVRSRDEVEERLVLDPQTAVPRIVDFIRTTFVSSGCSGIVVGLSGGIDSALTATLCVKAVGSEKVTGVFMFEERMRNGVDARHAHEIASNLRIRTVDLTLDPLIKRFSESFPVKVEDQVARGNLKARLRMMSLYYLANAENLLVAGTGDRSEDLIGYFTKYGDGGVDFLPIAHLYKSQVRFLAKHVGISPAIVEKLSSPNLWEGHKATDEIPLDYPELDRALVCLFDLKMKPEEVSKRLRISSEKVQDILSRFRSSAHKRAYPPMIGS
jgi:NAD+ synthase